MRWKNNPEPKNHEFKIFRKFLLFPIRLGDETRWLEYANIEYQFHCGYDDYQWEAIRFVD